MVSTEILLVLRRSNSKDNTEKVNLMQTQRKDMKQTC